MKAKIDSLLLGFAVICLALAAGVLFFRMQRFQEASQDIRRKKAFESDINNSTRTTESSQSILEPEATPVCYTVSALITNLYRIDPENVEARKYGEVSRGTELKVFDEHGKYYLCYSEDMEGIFCVEKSQVKEGVFFVSPENGIDLRYALPEAEYDLLFASENNIIGHAMYPPVPMLETKTAEMLKAAAGMFAEEGYKIRIYDSYRPKSAQFELYDIVQDARFIADPYVNNSFHQLGRAVDMSLVDSKTGIELTMPTPMHTFNEQASRYNRAAWSEEARKNVDYMTEVMERCGFRTIETEWWHFENGEAGDYMDPNLDYESLTLEPQEAYCEKYPQF